MNRGNATSHPRSWKILLVSATICAALAFGCGLVFAPQFHGFGPWQLVPLSLGLAAAIFGFLARRTFTGIVVAPLFGYTGAAGLLLGLVHEGAYLLEGFWAGLAVAGSFFGLICMVAGAVGGFVGQGWDHRITDPDRETLHIESQDEKGAR
jgi:hypothetical protein